MKQFRGCYKPLSGTKLQVYQIFGSPTTMIFFCLLLLFSPTFTFTRTTHTHTMYAHLYIYIYVYAYIFNNILQQLGVIFLGLLSRSLCFCFWHTFLHFGAYNSPLNSPLDSFPSLQLAVVVIYFHINVHAFFCCFYCYANTRGKRQQQQQKQQLRIVENP